MHDEDVATAAKWWSPESVIHDRVFRQNASMCYDFAMGSRPLTLPPLGSLEVAQISPKGRHILCRG